MGALFLNLKPGEYLKKQYKTKKLVEKTSFSLQAENSNEFFFCINLFFTRRRRVINLPLITCIIITTC
ncbi:hypothetical protein D9C11_14355 [Bacillus subtilis subsp. subtilis]|nr:hypothetical protein D9C11_14355 [Bacillus subtilis subsp. subtilis]